jgi:hypothetical protein
MDRVNMLMELFLPFPLGDDLHNPHLHIKNVWETCSYPGTTVLILAIALMTRVFGRRDARRARAAAGLVALGFYLCWGGWLPGFGGFREPMKARAIVALGLSLCAALGWQELSCRVRLARFRARRAPEPVPRQAGAGVFLAVAFVVALAASATTAYAFFQPQQTGTWLLRFGPPIDEMRRPAYALALANPARASWSFAVSATGVAAAAWMAVLLLAFLRRRPAFALGALGMLAVLDPFTCHLHAFASRHPFDAVGLPPDFERFARDEIAATRMAGAMPWRMSLPPSLANRGQLVDGLWETAGYDPLMPAGANNRIALPGIEMLPPSRDRATTISVALGRRFDFTQWRPEIREPLQPARRFETAPSAAIATIERKVVAGARSAFDFGPEIDGTHFVAPPGFARKEAPRASLPVEFANAVDGVRAAGDTTTSATADSVDTILPVETRTPNEFAFKVNLRAPALVILRMTWLPGWQVIVDGKPAGKPWCANNWMPACRVEAGRHTVVFRYRPVLFTPALVISGFCAFAVLALLIAARRRPLRL